MSKKSALFKKVEKQRQIYAKYYDEWINSLPKFPEDGVCPKGCFQAKSFEGLEGVNDWMWWEDNLYLEFCYTTVDKNHDHPILCVDESEKLISTNYMHEKHGVVSCQGCGYFCQPPLIEWSEGGMHL